MSQEKPAKIPTHKPSREEVLAALMECAEKLGRLPHAQEFLTATGLRVQSVRKHFGSFVQLLSEAGFQGKGTGYTVEMKELFLDWAGIVRAMGRLPSIAEYERRSQYTMQPLRRRFKGWRNVPLGLAQYAKENHLEDQCQDVLEIVRGDQIHELQPDWSSRVASRTPSQMVLRANRPTFGESLAPLPMTYAPTNELGVVFLFGMLAAELGFSVMRLQTEFPDCRAMRRVADKRWQEVWIEFEFESRNFLVHRHMAEGCDLIVCWEHNWPECPLEVVELKKVLSTRQSAFRPWL